MDSLWFSKKKTFPRLLKKNHRNEPGSNPPACWRSRRTWSWTIHWSKWTSTTSFEGRELGTSWRGKGRSTRGTPWKRKHQGVGITENKCHTLPCKNHLGVTFCGFVPLVKNRSNVWKSRKMEEVVLLKGKQKHIAPQAAYRTLENCRFTTIVLPKLDGLRDWYLVYPYLKLRKNTLTHASPLNWSHDVYSPGKSWFIHTKPLLFFDLKKFSTQFLPDLSTKFIKIQLMEEKYTFVLSKQNSKFKVQCLKESLTKPR